ncbi:MAG: hypothetical protein M3Q65_18900 [Chloroflexota bacterium]|nr:hypothetical protein [Chloroflexota bacterium]
MTRLVEALRTQELAADISLGGRWAELRGERGTVYVVETALGDGYFTWCDDPAARAVEFYRDPVEAIRAGLRRAAAPVQDR